jgi:hypothetical protein
MNADQAKAKAKQLVNGYPQAKNVQDLIELAKADNQFISNDEMLAVWGRVCRLLPQKQIG